jgi:hypothetical protein
MPSFAINIQTDTTTVNAGSVLGCGLGQNLIEYNSNTRSVTIAVMCKAYTTTVSATWSAPLQAMSVAAVALLLFMTLLLTLLLLLLLSGNE